jgi:hypothetical protein
MAAQVYGGSMAFVVGAYLWSYNVQYLSFVYPGDTVVSGLSMVLSNIRISGSQAVTSTQGLLNAPNPTFQMHAHARVNVCSLDSNAGSSAGSNVRCAQRLLRSPF